jgi:hypothetical protein
MLGQVVLIVVLVAMLILFQMLTWAIGNFIQVGDDGFDSNRITVVGSGFPRDIVLEHCVGEDFSVVGNAPKQCPSESLIQQQ